MKNIKLLHKIIHRIKVVQKPQTIFITSILLKNLLKKLRIKQKEIEST